MIVVTGATGHLGRGIVEALLTRLPADRIGVSVRDPDKANELATRGVRVRRGDFADAASLPGAFEGATTLLLVSSNARASGGDAIAQHRAAIDAGKAAGIERIVYTSQMAAGVDSAFPPMWDHAATEAMLADSGLAWTALRHGFYADSALMLMGDWRSSGTVAAPADGKVAWTAHADLAAADAAIVADIDGGNGAAWDGPTPPLTGAAALDLADLAAIAGARREVISNDDLRAAMAARSAPPAAADMLIGLYTAARNGEFARVDPTLERLIGREPRSMRDVIGALAD